MNALGYLITRSLINSITHRLTRLRQPKYLIGAVLAGAYFYFYFYKFLFIGLGPGKQFDLPPEQQAAWLEFGAAALFVFTLVLAWILPSSRAALSFTEAEIAFLFPAPIRRRTLIIFKILRSQLGFIFISILFTLISGRWQMGSAVWMRTAGWWFILNTLSLHRVGASFALSRLYERGLSDWKRRVVFIVALAGLAFAVWNAWSSLPPKPAAIDGKPAGALMSLGQLLQTGAIPWILAPFKMVVAPSFARDGMGFLMALGPALGVLAVHFLWVVRADGSFEDAAIETARRRSVLLAAARKGEVRLTSRKGKARTAVFPLRATGFKATAFLWKSLIRVGGLRTIVRWAMFFLALGGGAFWLIEHRAQESSTTFLTLAISVGAACYIAFLLSFVMVGQQAAGQLRQGIAGMDLLKTYPLQGWQFALGELLGPIVLGTLIQWMALATGTALVVGLVVPKSYNIGEAVPLIVTGLALFLPLFNLGTSILPSAAALAYPGWFKPGEAGAGTSGGGGVEVMGLRLLMGILQILIIAVACLPVAFFGAAAWFASDMFALDFAWKIAGTAATATLVLAIEAACGIAWLGWLFDRFDLSGE